MVRKTKKVLVSEHTEEKSVLDGFADIVNYKKSADGTVVRVVTKEPKYKKVQEVIPEHVERVHTGYEIVQVPARPVRISRSSAHKFLKKQAARKLRRLPVSEEVGTGASYKRHYDVAWMLD